MLKIGIVVYGGLETLTGGYIYDRMLVQHLRRRGHRVDIISLTRRLYVHNILDNFRLKRFAQLASSGYDLLLQDELTHPSLWWINRRLAKMGHFPLVAVVHQVLCRQPRNGLLNRLYEALERPYLNSVDACICNSASTRRAVARLSARSQPSIVASPAGDRLDSLDTPNSIEIRAREPGPLKLIFVGNVLPNKGLLPLIEDLSTLPVTSWHLQVVGNIEMDSVYYRRVKKKVDSANLTGQVVFAGPKDGPELSAMLAQSQVFVMPYSHEGFGMAHIEAMGFGLPVIGCAAGAVKEFVTHQQNGFLIDPADRQKTPAYLYKLNHDRQLLADMGRAAWETYQEHPRWEDTMEMIEGFLYDVVSHKL